MFWSNFSGLHRYKQTKGTHSVKTITPLFSIALPVAEKKPHPTAPACSQGSPGIAQTGRPVGHDADYKLPLLLQYKHGIAHPMPEKLFTPPLQRENRSKVGLGFGLPSG